MCLSGVLSKIKFGLKCFKVCIYIKYSKFNINLLNCLKRKGYIGTFFFCKSTNKIKVFLRYLGVRSILNISNKFNHKLFLTKKQLVLLFLNQKSNSIFILNTSYGFLYGFDVIKYCLGGEMLFYFS